MTVSDRPVLCAGQVCGDRRNCLRYRMRHSGAQWASFDIEHARIDKDRECPAFVHAHAGVRQVILKKNPQFRKH